MQNPPRLTDTQALSRHRARALRAPAMFLQDLAADEVQERLLDVNKRFTAPAVVSPFPQVWAPRLPGARIVPDADVLALEPGAHDLVIHALCLHWANDPVGQIVQCRRALRPDGLFLAVLFGGQTLAELRASLAEAESRLTGGLSPRVLPMGEIRDLGALLQRGGLALPVADALMQRTSYASAFHLMRDLRAMGETSALAARPRRFAPRALFAEAARIHAENFPAEDGRVAATFEMIFLTGWAPDDSQPKPLRPGSATHRLADALRTVERPLPESPAKPED
ncbi:methyltransferase domain-containing protein [Ruixingdingia sedimenti]|uniref:Methyltransferase domain-containing protein n=1 Tax=Ruixingdingia sedimenti TaxID=3073604 RepID=A0ABU1F6W9_9RHOB|nr:methyltransferase domain-containing protein [Xinfangfangia sp. LG-4]MDR5652621.1 methyltransferase domain-containing protein [Xinfangfangia sp. LG-4]